MRIAEQRLGVGAWGTLKDKALPGTKNVVDTHVLELAWRVDPRTGDTAIFTVGGNGYAVKETAEEVAEAVRQEKAAIIRSANQAGGPRPRLSLVDNNDT